MSASVLRGALVFIPFLLGCTTDTPSRALPTAANSVTAHLASLALDSNQVFAHAPTIYELALRDSVLALLPADARPVVKEILSRRVKNVLIGFSDAHPAALALYRRLVYAQITGATRHEPEAAPPVKVSLALPVNEARTQSILLRIPGETRANLIVLSPQDADGRQLGGVLEAFKALNRAASTSYGTSVLDGRAYSASLSVSRAKLAERLLTRLQAAPVVSLSSIGAAHVLDILLPSPSLEALLARTS